MERKFEVGDIFYGCIYYTQLVWKATDKDLCRWKIILGQNTALTWAYTYNPQLNELGTKKVEMYRDTAMRLCARTPKEKT